MGTKTNIAIVLIIIIAFAGYYYYNGLSNLTYRLDGVDVMNIGLTSATLKLHLTIENPLIIPVYMASASFDVSINDQFIGTGHIGPLTLNSFGRQEIESSLDFQYASLGLGLISILTNRGTIEIKIEGTANMMLYSTPIRIWETVQLL